MLRILRSHPHCNNCKSLKKKRTHFHCKSWKTEVHPEYAGHLHENVDETHSVYHVNCHGYKPKKNL